MNIQPKTSKKKRISRRATIKGIGAAGAMALFGKGLTHTEQAAGQTIEAAPLIKGKSTVRDAIFEKVSHTVFIDTHEHIVEEKSRLWGEHAQRDWTALFHGYLNSDMSAAGIPAKVRDQFFSSKADPAATWQAIAPYWPAVKNTGYAKAVRISIKELYDVDEVSAETAGKIQTGYQNLRKPGFYKYVLQEKAKVESCQVNNITVPFLPFIESQYPDLLMQDLGALHMITCPDKMITNPENDPMIQPTGINVRQLNDWYKVIDWWFKKYAEYAVAIKSQHAYSRDIDHQKVTAEEAAPIFNKIRDKQTVTPLEKKLLEDHLFWYAAQKATSFNLPIKLHTGYYAGENTMPLSRVSNNPSSAADLCRLGPDNRFIFMHICYPYYEPLIALAKHYANAYIDMCWAWIINPVAAKDFLKKYLVTAPANKILTFGGDYGFVEQVVGHAVIARRGIALALTELVEDDLLTLPDALALIDPIMHGNARKIFDLEKKSKILKNVHWQ